MPITPSCLVLCVLVFCQLNIKVLMIQSFKENSEGASLSALNFIMNSVKNVLSQDSALRGISNNKSGHKSCK